MFCAFFCVFTAIAHCAQSTWYFYVNSAGKSQLEKKKHSKKLIFLFYFVFWNTSPFFLLFIYPSSLRNYKNYRRVIHHFSSIREQLHKIILMLQNHTCNSAIIFRDLFQMELKLYITILISICNALKSSQQLFTCNQKNLKTGR